MSDAPSVVVDRLLRCLLEGDRPGAAACFDSDFVDFLAPHAPGIPWIPEVHDRSGIEAFLNALDVYLEPDYVHLEQRVEDGGDVVLRGSLRSKMRSAGRWIESPIVIWITVRNGLVVRYHLYEDSWGGGAGNGVEAVS